jgi:hypothetical protein
MICVNFVTGSIKPICLPVGPDQTKTLEGNNMIVSGWGTTEKGDIRYNTGSLLIKGLPLGSEL